MSSLRSYFLFFYFFCFTMVFFPESVCQLAVSELGGLEDTYYIHSIPLRSTTTALYCTYKNNCVALTSKLPFIAHA